MPPWNLPQPGMALACDAASSELLSALASSAAMPSPAQRVLLLLPSPFLCVLGLNCEKLLLHASTCMEQMLCSIPAASLWIVAAHPSWQVVVNGRKAKATEGSSPWKSHSGAHVIHYVSLIALMLCRSGREEQRQILTRSWQRGLFLAAECPSCANSLTIAPQADLLGLSPPFQCYHVITFLSASAAHSARDSQSSCLSYCNNLLQRMQLAVLVV